MRAGVRVRILRTISGQMGGEAIRYLSSIVKLRLGRRVFRAHLPDRAAVFADARHRAPAARRRDKCRSVRATQETPAWGAAQRFCAPPAHHESWWTGS